MALVVSALPTETESPSSRRAWIEIEHGHRAHRRIHVALLAEGVDRNGYQEAWADYRYKVALLAEGVDRNTLASDTGRKTKESPSSRRAWIEIVHTTPSSR